MAPPTVTKSCMVVLERQHTNGRMHINKHLGLFSHPHTHSPFVHGKRPQFLVESLDGGIAGIRFDPFHCEKVSSSTHNNNTQSVIAVET